MLPPGEGQKAGELSAKSALWIEKLIVGGVASEKGGKPQGWVLVQESPNVTTPEPQPLVTPPQPDKPPVTPTPEPPTQPEKKSPQLEPVEEESWQPQQERKTDHPFYQDMNEGEDPNSPKWKSIKEEMAKKQKGEKYGHQELIDNMDVVSELLKNDEVKKM